MSPPVSISDILAFERAIVTLQRDATPPVCYDVTLQCGHQTTLVVWPVLPVMPCAQCVHDYLDANRANQANKAKQRNQAAKYEDSE